MNCSESYPFVFSWSNGNSFLYDARLTTKSCYPVSCHNTCVQYNDNSTDKTNSREGPAVNFGERANPSPVHITGSNDVMELQS